MHNREFDLTKNLRFHLEFTPKKEWNWCKVFLYLSANSVRTFTQCFWKSVLPVLVGTGVEGMSKAGSIFNFSATSWSFLNTCKISGLLWGLTTKSSLNNSTKGGGLEGGIITSPFKIWSLASAWNANLPYMRKYKRHPNACNDIPHETWVKII